MNKSIPILLVIVLCAVSAGNVEAAEGISVLSAGPRGEIATLQEANEVRVVFSDPMVVIGRIPQPVKAPFFHITPQVPGTFRWSGTTTLIFTPDPKRPLPFATRYEVTIDANAASVDGKQLGKPYTFSFTTPTVKLLQTNWYRKSGRFSDPVMIVLRFNQAVSAKSIGEHLSLRYLKHDWKEPALPQSGLDWLKKNDPASVAAFQEKVAKTRKVVSSESKILGTFATEWNRKEYPPSPDLLVFETQPGVPPDAWIRVALDERVAGLQGAAAPGKPQHFDVQLEPTLFVNGFRCQSACDPDSWNPLIVRGKVLVSDARKATTVVDITGGSEKLVKPASSESSAEQSDYQWDNTWSLTFEDLGYSHQPAHSYRVKVEKSLQATDGQTLGYTWAGTIEDWHEFAFTSFGEGHGVWEKGDPLLPFYARNTTWVEQSLAAMPVGQLMPTTLKLEENGFRMLPDAPATRRKLPVTPDKIQSHGIDVSKLLNPQGSGLIWAGITDGDPIPRAHRAADEGTRSSLVQVTNLGISVKDSPLNTLVFVTRLDDGQPVEGANVSLIDTTNKTVWRGTTDRSGLALAPDTPLRIPHKKEKTAESDEEADYEWWDLWKTKFLVVAEKDGDTAYVGSNWTEGILPWDFGQNFNLRESQPLMRGTLFTDRGVYKLGEEIHFKAILRTDTPTGIRLYPRDTAVEVVLKDSRNKEVDKRTIRLGDWSSADWTVTLPPEGALGNYSAFATVEGQTGSIAGSFLVAAYRRPDFRVDATLAGDPPVAGTKLSGAVSARYLFGGAMSGRKVNWTYSKTPSFDVPDAISDRFPQEKWTFLGWDPEHPNATGSQTIQSKETVLDRNGTFGLELDTDLKAGIPLRYMFEGEVEDVSRQKIAGRASMLVHPAPWYIGVKALPYFASVEAGVDTAIVAAALSGDAVPGIPVNVTLTRVQWHSVRRAEGNGFYTWDVERTESEAGKWNLVTASDPAPLHIDLKDGGYFVLRASASDAEGRSTTTITTFYVLGPGYTAWARYDHNRIDLVPEKKTYRPGDSARIMIQSPWEKATALVTTEREGVKSYRQFELTSTQQTVSVPVTEADIPNVFVSVLLVKGRTKEPDTSDTSDPGKPSFRLGYAELKVEDAAKKLKVDVKANREEYRPASKAKIEVAVTDSRGKAAQAEVTLWAVDYGVLSLTAYQTPDIIDSVYIEKAIQVVNEDSRQKIISRRVLTPKGADEGGGGGVDSGPGAMRKDFRVLAFWLGSVTTDRKGVAKTEVTLPESLTTYRIMAVAADRDSRFGWGQREIRTSKPVLLRAAYPRFLAVGDKALFGSVVQNQLPVGGMATVTIRSLDPSILEVSGSGSQSVDVAAGASSEVRFDALAKSTGNARIQMSVKLRGESDSFEDVIPVRVLVSPETVAAYGEARPESKETVEIPAGVVPTFGGLHIDTSSTAMVGLGEGARFLVEYPYGCAEQRASRGLAILLAGELGEAFRLPGIEPDKLRMAAQANITELEKFQCDNGGFAYWPGDCWFTSPYLTSYVVHVLQRAKALKYTVDQGVLDRAYSYLQQQLSQPRPANEGWWPAYTAWQAFAVKVLAEGGQNQDSNINRLWNYRDRMPVFAMAYLLDAMGAAGEKGNRPDLILKEIGNSILPEGGTAHVEELNDPYLLYFWNSNVRSTAVVLRSLVGSESDGVLIPRIVRWLMQVRKEGRWGNTQENALAMEALVDYYRKFETDVPDFTGVVTLGSEELTRQTFSGRSTEAKSSDVPMAQLLSKAPAGQQLDLVLRREGTGTLFWMTRLRYAVDALFQEGLDNGFQVERHYYPMEGKTASKTFKAGDMVRVVLDFQLPKERRFVAVTDPVPAGFEPVESWFATTSTDLARAQRGEESRNDDWTSWWKRGGFDHVERHDDRVMLFATRLAEGKHTFSYVVRATTAGTFRTAPAHAEEMYEPEAFGRTATDIVDVRP